MLMTNLGCGGKVSPCHDVVNMEFKESMTTTRERFLEKYHTYSRRPAVTDKKTKRTMFKSFRRTLGPWLPQDKSACILDVGCGEGYFLLFLKENGYQNLSGFDISPENVSLCHESGLSFVMQFDALNVGNFPGKIAYDAIFVLDLLEHIPKNSASEFLRQIRAKLSKNGQTVIQTLNMGSLFGFYHRYADLTHEFSLTEGSAASLLMTAGFDKATIEIRPAWNATMLLGYLRESYLRILQKVIFLAEDSSRPSIPTKNLLIRAIRRD